MRVDLVGYGSMDEVTPHFLQLYYCSGGGGGDAQQSGDAPVSTIGSGGGRGGSFVSAYAGILHLLHHHKVILVE